ncbi:MAG: hypothetical protein H0X30_30930 [Anaerolineae bacterium]|nr:hypothetical protein [Anaerolineae bacterium]
MPFCVGHVVSSELSLDDLMSVVSEGIAAPQVDYSRQLCQEVTSRQLSVDNQRSNVAVDAVVAVATSRFL